ncbi:MAG: DUF411 domain-containing protein [Acidobacteria bacterium]|nr:DUF411 domain-containing protein [Acidobacteriota bacterium]
MLKRVFGTAFLAVMVSMSGASAQRQAPQGPLVQVYKSPTCGCCANWVKHLQDNGFATRVVEFDDLGDIKAKNQVPRSAQSCHTATVDGYALEGHVPAADVKRLLKERPAVLGLAVPGMPIGSPGMEVPGVKAQAYNVMSFDRKGQLTVYASH